MKIILWACLLLVFNGPLLTTHANKAIRGHRLEQAPTTRKIQFADLPDKLHSWLQEKGITADNFSSYLNTIERQTDERERQGEFDHLIFFALQSTAFTRLPKIEPARSAYQFVQTLPLAERTKYLDEKEFYLPSKWQVPSDATARLKDFLATLQRKNTDERLLYFREFLQQQNIQPAAFFSRLSVAYTRTMKFLYRKEFLTQNFTNQQELANYIAALYQQRGHSTDTQIEANFALFQALEVIKAIAPAQVLHNVLIVGPGLDFAPRTDLLDAFGPQSYQPFAVADALLQLRLTQPAQLRIHCVDINERVINYLNHFAQGKQTTLSLISGLANNEQKKLSADYQNYFQTLGNNIGVSMPLSVPANLAQHLSKSLRVKPSIAAQIGAKKLNIITTRYDGAPPFDLVIVTNVFPYFDEVQLTLALSNIAALMKPGAFLLHNEARANFAGVLGLPLLQARTTLIATTPQGNLYDGVAIHQKCKGHC